MTLLDTKSVLVWFRNDLRVSDHAPLSAALASKRPVTALYVHDERLTTNSPFGFPRIGERRRAFVRECLDDLAPRLAKLGVTLTTRTGKPAHEVVQVARAMGASAVHAHGAPGTEEMGDERAAATMLLEAGVTFTCHAPQTLVDAANMAQLPEMFTQFRTQVERRGLVVPEPLGTPPEAASADGPGFRGGSGAAWAHLRGWMWDRDRLRRYKETRNGMLNSDDSSKLSPWLTHGCISAREVYAEVRRYERERVGNESTYWLIFELLWRDYFHLLALKHGARLFRASGLQGLHLPWRENAEAFARWRDGRTGYPFVDANMRELALTGFMSNRGRQNVGSFLTKNLGLDWRMGAEYFESQLIDYDVASNWGNWNYTAGVGNDARGFRFFNIHKQANDYDPSGDYVRRWLLELAGVPGGRVHRPELLTADELHRFGLTAGEYPAPMVNLFGSAHENEEAYRRAVRGSVR